MNFKLTNNYFGTNSKKTLRIIGILGFAISAILLITSITSAINSYYFESHIPGIVIWGITLAAFLFIFIYSFRVIEISDSMYEQEIKQEIDKNTANVLEKLSLDESEVAEVSPINISGYNYNNFENIKIGADYKARTDSYWLASIYPTQNELNIYEYDFSTTKESSTEKSTVYFYDDIISLSVKKAKKTIASAQDKKGKKISYNKDDVSFIYYNFEMETKSGSKFSLSLKDENDSIVALKNLIKERKRNK